jgi:KR domain
MCRFKAKNLIVLSRSGLKSSESIALAAELREKGVRFVVYNCNVGDESQLEEVLNHCKRDLPPIRGLIHGGMELKVTNQCPFTA